MIKSFAWLCRFFNSLDIWYKKVPWLDSPNAFLKKKKSFPNDTKPKRKEEWQPTWKKGFEKNRQK